MWDIILEIIHKLLGPAIISLLPAMKKKSKVC